MSNSVFIKFKVVKNSEFIPKCFNYHPIWSEYYEPDEYEDFVNWGINVDKAKKEIELKFEDGSHPYYTIPIRDYPPVRMRFFTKSEFITKSGIKLRGAIMNEGETVISLFMSNEESISISNHPQLKDMALEDLNVIAKRYRLEISDLEELKFRTLISSNGSNQLSGVFKI